MKTTVNAGDKTTLAVIVFGSVFGAVMGNAHAAQVNLFLQDQATGQGIIVTAQENVQYDLDKTNSDILNLQADTGKNTSDISILRGDLNATAQSTTDNIKRIDDQAQAAIDGVKSNVQSNYLELQGEVNSRQGADNALAHQINLTNGALQQTDDKAQAAIDGVKTNIASIDDLKTGKAEVASLDNEIKQRQTDVANIIQDQRDTATKQATTDAVQNGLIDDATNVANTATTVANSAQNKADVAYSAGVYAQQQASDAATVAAVNKAAVANVQSRQQAQETTIQNHSAQLNNHEERITALENESNNNFRNLKDDVDNNRKRAAVGVASVAAMSNIPQVTDSQAFAIGAGVGGYDSQGAVAIGISARITDHIVTKASVGAGSFGGATYGAGVSFGY